MDWRKGDLMNLKQKWKYMTEYKRNSREVEIDLRLTSNIVDRVENISSDEISFEEKLHILLEFCENKQDELTEILQQTDILPPSKYRLYDSYIVSLKEWTGFRISRLAPHELSMNNKLATLLDYWDLYHTPESQDYSPDSIPTIPYRLYASSIKSIIQQNGDFSHRKNIILPMDVYQKIIELKLEWKEPLYCVLWRIFSNFEN